MEWGILMVIPSGQSNAISWEIPANTMDVKFGNTSIAGTNVSRWKIPECYPCIDVDDMHLYLGSLQLQKKKKKTELFP